LSSNHDTKTKASKHQRYTWWFSRIILSADTPLVAAPPTYSRFGQCGQCQLSPSPTKHHDQRNILFLRMRLLTAASPLEVALQAYGSSCICSIIHNSTIRCWGSTKHSTKHLSIAKLPNTAAVIVIVLIRYSRPRITLLMPRNSPHALPTPSSPVRDIGHHQPC
jgi:hypothetical protein